MQGDKPRNGCGLNISLLYKSTIRRGIFFAERLFRNVLLLKHVVDTIAGIFDQNISRSMISVLLFPVLSYPFQKRRISYSLKQIQRGRTPMPTVWFIRHAECETNVGLPTADATTAQLTIERDPAS